MITIAGRQISEAEPTYLIADIAANHDGDLERAKALIHLAAESGVDAAKFQHFRAPHIVSDYGFRHLDGALSHQAKWIKPVTQVYAEASLPWEWTEVLKEESEKAGVHFFSAPYDLEAVEMLDQHVPAFKIGSGDITWFELLRTVASRKKPVILATGASSVGEVQMAADVVLESNPQLALLQCNTNYTGSLENFHFIQLNVLRTYRSMYPDLVLGLSDHTPGHATVLGAAALGARIIEKHFTDDTSREGPDHGFSMDPRSWREMVDRLRELESALGDGRKRVERNESETVIVQRRCIRAARDLPPGTTLTNESLDVLRPAPPDGIPPFEIDRVIGKKTRAPVQLGEHLTWEKLE